MSVGIAVDVRDLATPAIEAKLAKCEPARLANIIGPGLSMFTKRHLLANGTNKRGWPTTNFWARAGEVTSWTGTNEGVLISIDQIGVRQRYHGGPISPVKARALTIPISPEAYGKTASDFPGAFLLKTKKGAYIVQRGESLSAAGNVVRSKGRGFAAKRVVASLEFLFKLSGGVTQPPDESVIPSSDDYAAVALAEIERAVQ